MVLQAPSLFPIPVPLSPDSRHFSRLVAALDVRLPLPDSSAYSAAPRREPFDLMGSGVCVVN